MDNQAGFTNTVEAKQNDTHKCPFCKQRVTKDRRPVHREVIGEDELGNKKLSFYTETEVCCTGQMLKEIASSPRPVGRKHSHRTLGKRQVRMIPTAPGYRGLGVGSRSPRLAATRRTRIAMADASRYVNRGA